MIDQLSVRVCGADHCEVMLVACGHIEVLRIAPVTVIAPLTLTRGTMRLICGVFDRIHESVNIDVLREGLGGVWKVMPLKFRVSLCDLVEWVHTQQHQN